MAFGSMNNGNRQMPLGGNQCGAAGGRNAGTAGNLHHHRALAYAFRQSRFTQGIEQPEYHSTGSYRICSS